MYPEKVNALMKPKKFKINDRVVFYKAKMGIVTDIDDDNVTVDGVEFNRYTGKSVDNLCPWCYIIPYARRKD